VPRDAVAVEAVAARQRLLAVLESLVGKERANDSSAPAGKAEKKLKKRSAKRSGNGSSISENCS